MHNTSDLRISGRQEVISASSLLDQQPISDISSQTVFNSRKEFSEILSKKDKRLAVVVGPCSIHDTESAMEYANLLLKEKKALEKELLIVMRVYFEKPRTTVGWKGLINDPDLILMDEPLGALDALTREKMQSLVLKIWKETGKTIILITHSVEEALLLGERLYVMAPRPGRIHKEYNLPFAEMGLKEDLREIKNNKDFVSKRE